MSALRRWWQRGRGLAPLRLGFSRPDLREVGLRLRVVLGLWALVGVSTGCIVAAFDNVVRDVMFVWALRQPIALAAAIPAVGLTVALLVARLPGHADTATTDAYVRTYHERGGTMRVRTCGPSYNSDGSLTVYVQNEQPSGANEQQNWLPAPDAAFVLVMHVYWPARAGTERHLVSARPEEGQLKLAVNALATIPGARRVDVRIRYGSRDRSDLARRVVARATLPIGLYSLRSSRRVRPRSTRCEIVEHPASGAR